MAGITFTVIYTQIVICQAFLSREYLHAMFYFVTWMYSYLVRIIKVISKWHVRLHVAVNNAEEHAYITLLVGSPAPSPHPLTSHSLHLLIHYEVIVYVSTRADSSRIQDASRLHQLNIGIYAVNKRVRNQILWRNQIFFRNEKPGMFKNFVILM